MYPSINKKISYDLERIMHCVQYSYERTATSIVNIKPKCEDQDCNCKDPIVSNTEGLKEKTKELKHLLDSHN